MVCTRVSLQNIRAANLAARTKAGAMIRNRALYTQNLGQVPEGLPVRQTALPQSCPGFLWLPGACIGWAASVKWGALQFAITWCS